MNKLTLKIAGKRCSLGIAWLRVQQQINDIPSAHMELRIPHENRSGTDNTIQHEVNLLTLGVEVVITWDNTPLFSGYLAQKKIQLKGKCWSVKVEARHVLQTLTFLPRNRIFRKKADRTILKGLFQQAGVKLTLKTMASLESPHDQMIQFGLSDWQFIRSRLLSTNCWLLPDAASDRVVISSMAEPVTATQIFSPNSHDFQLYEINLNFDNRFTLDSLSLQGWDVATQQLAPKQKSLAKAFRPWKPTSERAQTSSTEKHYSKTFSYIPENSLKTLSSSWLNYHQMSDVQGRIVISGTRNFRLGDSIRLSQFGVGLDGTAILSGVTQLFDGEQGWRSELVIGLAPSVLEPIPPVRSLHIGTVADFTVDPQHLDRIAVHLPALALPDSFVFARLSKPWASPASGFCFYPEPGDEVVVGFIESDPRYPVILGAMHNPKNPAPFPPHEKNNHKGIIMKKDGQTQALMIDTEKKTLSLVAGDNTLSLNDEEGITLNTTKTLQFKAETFVQQGNKISIGGKEQIEITSKNINMKK